jgi:hypothetical protein
MIRMYVTWSMPPSCTNCSSSSVADMNSSPDATRSYANPPNRVVIGVRPSKREVTKIYFFELLTYERWQMPERAPL